MQDIGGALATLLGGNYVNRFNLHGRSYEVIPQVPRDYRLTADWLTRYQVRTSGGELVPLSTVATLAETVQPNALGSFQQLNAGTLTGVPFPGQTLGAALALLEEKDRTSVVKGKSVSVRVALGGRRLIQHTTKNH